MDFIRSFLPFQRESDKLKKRIRNILKSIGSRSVDKTWLAAAFLECADRRSIQKNLQSKAGKKNSISLLGGKL